MTLTPADLARLRRLAEKATPVIRDSRIELNGSAQATYIAAYDPRTVLALLDEIDRLRPSVDPAQDGYWNKQTCSKCGDSAIDFTVICVHCQGQAEAHARRTEGT